MEGYIHIINRLPPASTYGGGIVHDMRSGDYVAREVDHVLLGAKTWPYSVQDAMVIYNGEDPHITTFLDLPNSVQRAMLSTALRVGEYIFRNNESNIASGRLFPIIGTNMGTVPAPRMIQTITNPHFHTTVFPQYTQGEYVNIAWLQSAGVWEHMDDGIWGISSTQVVEIDVTSEEHQKIFCIRPNNLLLRSGFMERDGWWTETNLCTLDIPLTDQRDVFTSESNMKQFHDIYKKANTYIRSITLAWKPDNRWFGISFIYDVNDGIWKIRLAFMEKNDSQDNGSICESSGHSIVRKVTTDPSRVMDTRPFVRSVAKAVFQN